MTELSQIIRLNASEAAAVHERAAAGDLAAVRTFALYSSWKRIKGQRRYSSKDKREALRFLIDRFSFSIGGPEDVQTPPESSLAPNTEQVAEPWWGD